MFKALFVGAISAFFFCAFFSPPSQNHNIDLAILLFVVAIPAIAYLYGTIDEQRSRYRSAAAKEMMETIRAIEILRRREGDSVEILCDNPEGDPNNAIVCCGEWTSWIDKRFGGESLLRCLELAVDAYNACDINQG